MADLPYALSISPDSALQFNLTPDAENNGDGASRCIMTLTHPRKDGRGGGYLAFKVKTTQPRRYLVRPNQGIVAPGSSETVSILLVDKDRQQLQATYNRLGQSALDHSKDKFLVQSCAVPDDFAAQFKNEPRGEGGQYKKELVDALTSMWNKATSGGSEISVYNKKLHVKHSMGGSAGGGGTPAASAPSQSSSGGGLPATFDSGKRNNADKMSPDQLQDEVSSLRRKYDELVAFSVNLTAERDILNNTLEQTKRDLNRESATRTALEKQGLKVGSRSASTRSGEAGGYSLKTLLLLVAVTFVFSVKGANTGALKVLKGVPVLGDFLEFPCCSKHKKKKLGDKDEF